MTTKHAETKKDSKKPESRKQERPAKPERDNKTAAAHGGKTDDAMLDALVKEPAGPQSTLAPAPGDSQVGHNLAAQVAERGWINPPQGKLVLAEKDGVPMLAQFKINSFTGPKGAFYSQMTPKGGFSNFEGKVDAWIDVPEMRHRKAAQAA